MFQFWVNDLCKDNKRWGFDEFIVLCCRASICRPAHHELMSVLWIPGRSVGQWVAETRVVFCQWGTAGRPRHRVLSAASRRTTLVTELGGESAGLYVVICCSCAQESMVGLRRARYCYLCSNFYFLCIVLLMEFLKSCPSKSLPLHPCITHTEGDLIAFAYACEWRGRGISKINI